MTTSTPSRRAVIVALAIFLQLPVFAMNSHLIFLGTYTRDGSRGIYAVRLDDDTGLLSMPTVAAETPNPAWITLSPDKKFLYALHESTGQAVGFSVDAASAQLTPLPAEKAAAAQPPAHLVVDATGRALMAANYREGYVSSMAIRPDGTLGQPVAIKHAGKLGPNAARQDKPHTHSVTLSPDNRFVIVCDLGLDQIYSYALDPAAAKLTPANPAFVATAPGAGPRHFKFGADGRHAYAINELGGTIAVYDYAATNGALTPRQTVSTLPAGFKGENTTAEVRVHPNGKFLYGSNRGHDSVAVFAIDQTSGELTPVEIVPSGGKTPRNFALSPNGKWLVCAHQDSNNLTVFRVDPATGRLTRTANGAVVPLCVCVLFYD